MKQVCYTVGLFLIVSCTQAQEKWGLYNVSMHYGVSSITKKMNTTGFVFSWDAAVRKDQHMLGAEYETATNMRIAGNRYAVDQINLLYGRNLLKTRDFVLAGFAGTGFYRQSYKPIGSDEKWTSETAIGLKLKLAAQYPVYKQLHVSLNPNLTLNFSSTYFSLLAGLSYRF
ncbi:MAG: hypothetical protein KIT80_17235 [Chitinophagaceae bacterium]|nr:hypothetical protein [Chitinophagaceae bacterium]MCW5928666.1 hypothetical protein [Chitinophagaceae bacterium]